MSIRIIGGRWRGRHLDFPDQVTLRPTPDRVRETVFNWLQREVVDAHCLDAFAGSGALGFEALSRGASSACFLETDPFAYHALLKNAEAMRLPKQTAQIFLTSALMFSPQKAHMFDLVFLDPPFHQNLLPQILQRLQEGRWLSSRAKIYVEFERDYPITPLIQTLQNGQLEKILYAGAVGYALVSLNAARSQLESSPQ